jgi:hypothetical protein
MARDGSYDFNGPMESCCAEFLLLFSDVGRVHHLTGNVNYDCALTVVHFITEVCVLSN